LRLYLPSICCKLRSFKTLSIFYSFSEIKLINGNTIIAIGAPLEVINSLYCCSKVYLAFRIHLRNSKSQTKVFPALVGAENIRFWPFETEFILKHSFYQSKSEVNFILFLYTINKSFGNFWVIFGPYTLASSGFTL